MQNLALLQLLDWLLDGKGSLTLNGRLYKSRKRGSPMSKTWGFFLVAQDIILSQRAKFRLSMYFFRFQCIFSGFNVFCHISTGLQGSVLGQVLFILFVDDITKDFPWGAHASLYADDLAIWSSSPDPLKASSVVQFSLNVLETWSNLWRLPLNPKKCESSFFSTDLHQATFQPLLNLLGIPLLFNPTPKFLSATFDRTLILWGPHPIPGFEILSMPKSPSLHSHCLVGSHERISLHS